MDNQNPSHYPKPGDLIEIFRDGFQHWAIYVGGGYVIHLTSEGGSGVGSSHAFSSSTIIGEVRREPLSEVAGSDRYRVNNRSDKKWQPLPVDWIVKNAKAELGKIVVYNPITANCEHFVNELRYSESVSHQAEEIQNAAVVGVGAVVGALGGVVAVVGAVALVALSLLRR